MRVSGRARWWNCEADGGDHAGSGTVNEDGYGVLGRSGEVEAAWIFDGVTGINGRNYLPAASDAA